VHCYGSHGLSVGSQTAGGLCNVLFENSTLNGYDSLGNLSVSDTGIQIKTDANSGELTYSGVNVTPIQGTGTIPTCDIAAFGPPPVLGWDQG
jgi:polygalacturonase